MDSGEGSSTPQLDQAKPKQIQGDGRSSQPYRRPNQNFTGNNNNNMFDPMMAMNMGLMNPLQFQLMMQQTGTARPGQLQQQQQRSTNLPSESQPPPSGYVCYKCGQAGHWIYYCPIVPKGQYVPRHANALSSSIPPPTPLSEADAAPEELVCTVCKDLLRKPSASLCCGKSFCEECITNIINTNQQCPQCGKDSNSIQIIPNKTLRKIVDAFLEERQANKVDHPVKQQQQEDLAVSDHVDSHQTNDPDTNNTTHNDQKSSNRPPHHKQQQPFDSSGHGRKHNMDSMGLDYNGMPQMPPPGLPFMPNPAMFMGGGGTGGNGGGNAPPFGFPDMSWMFGGNSATGGRGAFPSVNGMPPMPPLFFGSNGGAPIHYPGGFSNRARNTTGGRSTNTQQQPSSSSDRRQNDTNPPTDSATTNTTTSDSRSLNRQHENDNTNDKKSSTSGAEESSKSRHRSPSSRSSTASHYHHRDSRKRSRSRSYSPRRSSSRRRHSSITSHRKSRRTSRSPSTRHHRDDDDDDDDDILDYGDNDDEPEDDDRHHRRHRSSRHRSRSRSKSSRRHHGSSSSRYRSSSRRRHSNDRHSKGDRYRDSSRDRSHRYDKK